MIGCRDLVCFDIDTYIYIYISACTIAGMFQPDGAIGVHVTSMFI